MVLVWIGILWILASVVVSHLVLYPRVEKGSWTLKVIMASYFIGFFFLASQLIYWMPS